MNTNAIHLGQIQVESDKPKQNMTRIESQARLTKKGGILVLPEMAVSGYFLGDRWLEDSSIEYYREFNNRIIELSQKYSITIVWGNIDFDKSKKNEDGSIRKYNASYIASNGKLLKTHYKTLLPNYRMFDDKRYFTSLETLAKEENRDLQEYYKPVEVLIDGVKTKVAMLVCEDIWNINSDYSTNPLEMTKAYSPDLITVVSASPFGLEKAKFRDKLLKIQSSQTTIAYVNPVGIQNNGKNIFNFDGGSSVYQNGKFVKQVEDYSTQISPHPSHNYLSFGPHPTPLPKGEGIVQLKSKTEVEQIFDALVYTIKMFWKQNSWEKASIGLSGGLDSAVVASLLSIALGSENITAINMPSKFNSDTTKSLAQKLAKNLGINYIVDPIQDSVDLAIKRASKNRGGEKLSSFEIENIQARERGKTLADNAPYFGVFTCNGNKDEILTGYATLYGDTSGVIAVLGDLTKTQVKQLAIFINKQAQKELIPQEIIDMKPSAELSDAQNVDNAGGDPFDYEFLGAINKAFIEQKKSLEDILALARDGKLEEFLGLARGYLEENIGDKKEQERQIRNFARLKQNSFFKRIQMPPIPTISKASFGNDYREVQV